MFPDWQLMNVLRRPYLIKDGGNIEVVTVGPNGILALKLQGIHSLNVHYNFHLMFT
jgi:hypothetical protein